MRKFRTHDRTLRRRWPLVVGAVLVCLGSFSAQAALAGTSRDEEDTRVVKVTSQTRIYVENTRGKTIIVGRRDVDEVRIRVLKVVRAKDEKTAAKWMEELRYTVESDSEHISVVTRHPKKIEEGWNLWTALRRLKDKAYIDYTIEVPAGFDAKVSTTSGNVRITSLGGGVQLFGSSGDAFLKEIGGKVFIELSSGNVEGEDVGKDLHIRMSSGGAVVRGVGGSVSVQGTSSDVDIERIVGGADVELSSGSLILKACRGAASVSSQSGDIEVLDAEGPVKARATSGDVSVSLARLGAWEYVFETSSGDVDVAFRDPEGTGFILDVETGSGTIEGDLDIRLDEVSRKTLKGTVGRGEGRLKIETAGGDIRINQKDGERNR
jgi:DUF4097 and DUF4098 domain-containing protein YvlB